MGGAFGSLKKTKQFCTAQKNKKTLHQTMQRSPCPTHRCRAKFFPRPMKTFFSLPHPAANADRGGRRGKLRPGGRKKSRPAVFVKCAPEAAEFPPARKNPTTKRRIDFGIYRKLSFEPVGTHRPRPAGGL